MRIGELAKRAKLSPSKIRYYEGLGLLPQAERTVAGDRTYDATDLENVRFIDQARRLGYSINEINGLIGRSDRESCAKPERVRALEAKLAEIDDHLASVRKRRAEVLALIDEIGGRPPEMNEI